MCVCVCLYWMGRKMHKHITPKVRQLRGDISF